MHIKFPAAGNIPAVLKREGFVARPLIVEGRRRKTLDVNIYHGPKVEPLYFGYVAGRVTHLTSGLEHCTLVALFDKEKKLGAAGHFPVKPENAGAGCDSLNEFILNIKDMRNTLSLMEATKLQAFVVFGMTSSSMLAPAVDILQSINLLGIPVPGIGICRDGDHIYHSYLNRGVVNYHLDGTRRVVKLFEAEREPVDRAVPLLEKAEEVMEYFEEICADAGREQFMNLTLPYLAARHFSEPEVFYQKAMTAIDEGSERPVRSSDPKKETIGKYFRGLVRV